MGNTFNYITEQMFEEFRQVRERVPSAQATKAREDYLDLILGKLPEIPESQRGIRNKFYVSQKMIMSDASTADGTDLISSNKLEVEDVDSENKKEEEEEDYWQWQAKQIALLKLPIVYQVPKDQMRSFSTERRNKRRRVINITRDESPNEDKMNKTTFPIPPSAIKADKDDEEIEPLMQHRLNQIEEKYARKGRWEKKVEKEDDRTKEVARAAS